jgi:hypothetical protein
LPVDGEPFGEVQGCDRDELEREKLAELEAAQDPPRGVLVIALAGSLLIQYQQAIAVMKETRLF